MPLDPDDPLIPMVSPEEWIDPAAAGGDLNVVASQIADYYSLNSFVWPARDSHGNLVPPPADQVLDHLVHSRALLAEGDLLDRPPVDTVFVLSTLPSCDLCKAEDARYETHIEISGTRAGCSMGPSCYTTRGPGQLGTGHGSYLMLWAEVPPEVRQVCDELCSRVGRPSLWADEDA